MRISKSDLHWAAGFTEGEACFGYNRSKRGARIEVTQTVGNEELLDRLVKIFGGRVYGPYGRGQNDLKRSPNQKLRLMWLVESDEAMRVMGILYSFLGSRRRAQIDAVREKVALSRWD